ncbi:hypothetical protein BGW36DRAFT_376618 [Talaromyces proteolyticus]|uniref:Uncharacterized protein n=1 Tax=Talaromyces proteolyticus TaxID=1131652 RepID=A0AAD4PZ65_9EURO|nr:uncharacterized protein BGW36DRAFT_376618 [Talaromyces proteolyticus]KAH8698696.1 hypothetical protein BGW36DRAFT_376618 [Talaromyces proteolyticus]
MLIRGVTRVFPLIALVTLVTFFAFAKFKRNSLLNSWTFGYGGLAKDVVTPFIHSPDPLESDPDRVWDNGNIHDGSRLDLEKIPLPDLSSVQPSPQSQHQPELLGSEWQSTPDNTHNEIFSVSTPSRKYFDILFGEHETLNPNIIPHPSSNNKWIIVAQQKNRDLQNGKKSLVSIQLVCDAAFDTSDKNDGQSASSSASFTDNSGETLACVTQPTILPISATSSEDRCQGRWSMLAANIGPHDARVFYGPDIPYTIYGSNSQYTCFGQWMHDFRMLVDWKSPSNEIATSFDVEKSPNVFHTATELYRPIPLGEVEKNWFIFWDAAGEAYVHYDVWPKRSFAKIEKNDYSILDESSPVSITVGPDLSILPSTSDTRCMDKYMPVVPDNSKEFIHQATNSLSITLCKRSEAGCLATDQNTFIFTIFQKKTDVGFGASSYEPYVMLFRRTLPFDLHSISTKPFWIHGRKAAQKNEMKPEMMYVTSMSWKNHGQTYHGYSDDVLFLAFGIDDSRTAGIDIVAGDLLRDMGICMNV